MKIGGKHLLFHIITLPWGKDSFKNALYYCILDTPPKCNFISFDSRNFEVHLVPKPVFKPNTFNISIVNCKRLGMINQFRSFLNS